MKASKEFKAVIQNYLEEHGKEFPVFGQRLKLKTKNIDDCITYILNEVQKSGCNGFADDEIYKMARHYYDEDKIDIGKPVSGRVVVNHKVDKPKTPTKTGNARKSTQKDKASVLYERAKAIKRAKEEQKKAKPVIVDKKGQTALF